MQESQGIVNKSRAGPRNKLRQRLILAAVLRAGWFSVYTLLNQVMSHQLSGHWILREASTSEQVRKRKSESPQSQP